MWSFRMAEMNCVIIVEQHGPHTEFILVNSLKVFILRDNGSAASLSPSALQTVWLKQIFLVKNKNITNQVLPWRKITNSLKCKNGPKCEGSPVQEKCAEYYRATAPLAMVELLLYKVNGTVGERFGEEKQSWLCVNCFAAKVFSEFYHFIYQREEEQD